MGGVDVHKGQVGGSGQQRGAHGQAGEELPVGSVELEGVAMGERAQERAQR
ncbi:hypothetical protein [Streptomyces halobius]|uniref:Uncharacterized protein n=1 Tax=Streptomyces halobius TaxID=2879846 RepID=A0ABY4M1W8_9ACTN|nr:hypothetical protein [Streptomyces halobius]UQA91749.1 hypothetical protein K9S39_07610 [Streptomyces halobius]